MPGVTASVVGATRGDLRRLGILDVGVSGLGPQTPPAPGPKGVARQEVTFDVSYEFLKLPTAPSGVIASVPLDVDLSRDNDPTTLIAEEFGPQSLADFDVVDDPAAANERAVELAVRRRRAADPAEPRRSSAAPRP